MKENLKDELTVNFDCFVINWETDSEKIYVELYAPCDIRLDIEDFIKSRGFEISYSSRSATRMKMILHKI